MFHFQDLSKEEIARMVKFGVTGVVNTLVDVAVYTLLAVVLGVNVYVSQFFGYSAGMLNSYLVNRSWTFRTKDRFFSLQLVKFILTNLVVLVISLLFIKGFMDLGLGKLLAKLVATAFTLVINFFISRFWVFK